MSSKMLEVEARECSMWNNSAHPSGGIHQPRSESGKSKKGQNDLQNKTAS